MRMLPGTSVAESLWLKESDPARHEQLMHELLEPVFLQGLDNRIISARHVNQGQRGAPPILREGAMFAASTSAEQLYAMYQYGVANPNHQILLLDAPSHGESDDLTSAQRRQIFTEHKLDLIADSHVYAIRNFLPDDDCYIGVGDSMGFTFVVDFARRAGKVGLQPLLCIGFDPVDMEKRFSPGVAADFFIREPLATKKYRAQLAAEEAYETRFKAELQNYGFDLSSAFQMTDVYKNDPSLLAFAVAPLPLASGNTFDDLEKLMEEDERVQVRLLTGGASLICRWRNLVPRIEALEAQYGGRVQWEVSPYDSHGMSIAPQQPRLARHVAGQIAMLGYNI